MNDTDYDPFMRLKCYIVDNCPPTRINEPSPEFNVLATYILNTLKEISEHLNINPNMWNAINSKAGKQDIMEVDICELTHPQVKHQLTISSICGFEYKHVGCEGQAFTIDMKDHESTVKSLNTLIKLFD
jgi:hypothetical protein